MTEYGGFWYMQYQGVEHGPFGFGEVVTMLSGKKLEGTIHVWREGLAHWLPIRVDMLAGNTPALLLRRELIQYERSQEIRAAATQQASAHATTHRHYARRGLVATVYGLGIGGRRHYLGVLSDFSARGLGIRLEKTAQWPVGTEFKLEILPLTLTGLQSFRVGGTIRWTSATDMGLVLTDFAQAEQAMALLDLKAVATKFAAADDSTPTTIAA
jgi:hypothetical protein